ncbi:4-hydroxy-tetrahydrodipicolinate synthase [Antricoccus suffuscus]|uniref:4-hydroxy-tetrahydrodipicolinate synthase n=1 Tax=Antricoccus suffuscus TaxID=1629062 RepID=A0A2T0ZVX9_9ACTN|nr:dihydrodipicolinate synthase family protein [Antricoccus suffuscus]PRZ40407.1 4-hydroxy-tetrahydrodipicolinate synthase [Antricoccus suffuscus]
MTDIFHGIGVALVTLFDDEGNVDIDATTALAATLVGEGLTSVLVAGTTGEAAALTSPERADLVRAMKDALDVPIIAGTGAATGSQAAAQTTASVEAGADAVLVLSPHRVADPTAYYRTVAQAAGTTPMLAYHFPAQSAPGVEVPLLNDLPIVGIKDSSGDARRLLQEVEEFDGQIYSGAAALCLYGGALGIPGMLLAVANAFPQEAQAAFAGDAKAQLKLSKPDQLSSVSFPAGIKQLTHEAYGTSTTARIGR